MFDKSDTYDHALLAMTVILEEAVLFPKIAVAFCIERLLVAHGANESVQ